LEGTLILERRWIGVKKKVLEQQWVLEEPLERL